MPLLSGKDNLPGRPQAEGSAGAALIVVGVVDCPDVLVRAEPEHVEGPGTPDGSEKGLHEGDPSRQKGPFPM